MIKKTLLGVAVAVAIATGLFAAGCGSDSTGNKVTIKGATN